MPRNKDLNKALKAKKDEFYTQMEDIEKELKYYEKHFEGKVILCNCDNPRWSNFWKYMYNNFAKLKIKKLIATYYEPNDKVYKCEYFGKPSMGYIMTELKGNGDFRSDECIKILKEADIVIGNPPFSLFREYVAQLIKYDKKFLIIGNVNALKYKDIFPYIKSNKIWLGCSIHSGDREFRVPDDYPLEAAGYRVDENGTKYIRVKGVRWYTNLDYPERYKDLELEYMYDEEKYPKYDNRDIINVNKTIEIPCDYDEEMGVPITFLDKYNPEQFEILEHFMSPVLNGKNLYSRLIIKRKKAD